MNPNLSPYFQDLIYDLLRSDVLFFWLLVILTVLVIVLDSLSAIAAKKQKSSGVLPQITHVLSPGANFKEPEDYVSQYQQLSSRPDALLIENGYIIPVDRKIGGNKIRDRHVAELLVHMRLIEELEGKKPPYGYLILGKNARRVKILNTAQRQAWLTGILNEMRAIISGGKTAVAQPGGRKCKHCLVSDFCDAKAAPS